MIKYKVYLVIERKGNNTTYKLGILEENKIEIHSRNLISANLLYVLTTNKHFSKYKIKTKLIENEIHKYSNILNKYPNGDIRIEVPIK